MMPEKHDYEINLQWDRERIGTLSSPVLEQEVEVATPPQFTGGVEGKWSPEHLYVSSVAGCFMTTFIAIAEYSKLPFEDLKVNAIGKLEKVDGKYAMTTITLKAELLIAESTHEDKAIRLMEKAEAACLISRSINSEVVLEPKVCVGNLN